MVLFIGMFSVLEQISALDMKIELALNAVRDPRAVQFFIWVSELADEFAIFGLCLAVAATLAYKKEWPLIGGLFVAVAGSAAARFAIKGLVDRSRPPWPIPAYLETSSSFPSGHAILAVAFYGFLLWMILRRFPAPWRAPAIAVSLAIIILAGFSRLYLGVHYPSDVLAGYAVGALFLYAGIRTARYLQSVTT